MWESVRLMIFKGVSCSGGDGHEQQEVWGTRAAPSLDLCCAFF